MTKINTYTADGKKGNTIDMPKFLNQVIREDIIAKVIEAKKTQQPYGPGPMAGNAYSASGVLKHHRKVWKSQYGRGMSRVPRKTMTRRGSQFTWIGATVPNTRGGRRAHPPKVISMMMNFNKINKKEVKLAFFGALSATADGKYLTRRYETLNDVKVENVPFIVDSKFTELKAKELRETVKLILGKDLSPLALQKKTQRAGKGKSRGRKYKSTAGLLIVIGKDEKLKTTAFEVAKTQELGVTQLAKGGVGRLTLYTEQAVKELENKLSGKVEINKSEAKSK